jgi:hypothetical protein
MIREDVTGGKHTLLDHDSQQIKLTKTENDL